MPRSTDTTVAVSGETKQVLNSIKAGRDITFDEIIQAIIYSSSYQKLENGIVVDSADDIGEREQVGAECEECSNRVLSISAHETNECSQCGWNWFTPVFNSSVFTDYNESEVSIEDMIANTVKETEHQTNR